MTNCEGFPKTTFPGVKVAWTHCGSRLKTWHGPPTATHTGCACVGHHTRNPKAGTHAAVPHPTPKEVDPCRLAIDRGVWLCHDASNKTCNYRPTPPRPTHTLCQSAAVPRASPLPRPAPPHPTPSQQTPQITIFRGSCSTTPAKTKTLQMVVRKKQTNAIGEPLKLQSHSWTS